MAASRGSAPTSARARAVEAMCARVVYLADSFSCKYILV